MNVKNKKTLVAIIAVLLILAVGATIAYFQSSASFENIFNTGTYKVVTTEVFESPDNWKPGEEIPKTITTKNEGTIDATVRVSYTEKWEDEEGNDITSQIAAGTAIINLDNTSDWTKEGNYYYYNYILKPNDETSSFMKSVTLNPNLNGVVCTTSQDGLTKTCESTNPALGATYKLTITKETVQADRYQEVWNTNISITEKEPAITVISGTKGNLQPGDIIGIGETEDFYVLSSDNSQNGKTILLAKYSLLVGNTVDGYNVAGIVPTTTPGYGLQSVEATGYGTGESWKGTITFSDENYWMDGNELKSKYNPNNEIYLNTSYQDKWQWKLEYRSDNSDAYPYIYDENSNIYPYISGENGYVNKLIEMGAPSSTTGRLLSHEEIVAYENVTSNGTSILANGLSYWTGYAIGDDEVNAVYFDSNDTYIEKSYNTNDRDYCIRPVIEIPTSAIK